MVWRDDGDYAVNHCVTYCRHLTSEAYLMQHSNKFSQKPHAILFDLDHTFYDYDITHQQAFDETVQKAQSLLGVSPKDFVKAFEISRNQIKARLKGTAAEHNRLLYFQNTLENLN